MELGANKLKKDLWQTRKFGLIFFPFYIPLKIIASTAITKVNKFVSGNQYRIMGYIYCCEFLRIYRETRCFKFLGVIFFIFIYFFLKIWICLKIAISIINFYTIYLWNIFQYNFISAHIVHQNYMYATLGISTEYTRIWVKWFGDA